MFTVGLGWQRLAGTGVTTAGMTQNNKYEKSEMWRVEFGKECHRRVSHSSVLSPFSRPGKGHGEHSVNSNHRHNPSRTIQRHTERFLKWPVLLKPPVDDLSNVNNRSRNLDRQRWKEHCYNVQITVYRRQCARLCVCVWKEVSANDGISSSIPSSAGLSGGTHVGKKSKCEKKVCMRPSERWSVGQLVDERIHSCFGL